MTRLFTEGAVLLRLVELSRSFTASSQSLVCPSWLAGSCFWKGIMKSYCVSLTCWKITPTKKCLFEFSHCVENNDTPQVVCQNHPFSFLGRSLDVDTDIDYEVKTAIGSISPRGIVRSYASACR